MPLSDHEKQLLDEIEHDLIIDSPDLASTLRNHLPRGRSPVGLRTGMGLIVVGLSVVLLGVHADNSVGILVALVGYLVIVTAAKIILDAGRRLRNRR